ncbi:MAG: phage tail protein [bacterium]|nr:phage tail protein [bacterium]
MPLFRLIAEGITDLNTLDMILSIFYNDPKLEVEYLQPKPDATDRSKQGGGGGWGLVLNYLQSETFTEALTPPYNDCDFFIVIQIDTDVSQDFGIPHYEAGSDVPPQELFDMVKEKLIAEMDQELYRLHKERFIFAICIHSLECWFLPLFCKDKSKKTRTKNCLEHLNRELKASKKHPPISPEGKKPRLYEKMARGFKNHKTLMKRAAENPSFKIFIDSLPDDR